jgi:transcriptional regulator with PAS, ATPase and Fis domain
VGKCGTFLEVIRIVDMAATTKAPVLITGETGTGKNLVAKSIHYKGPNAGAAIVSINCAAIPENLIEAELFGYEKGAFTGASGAKKGLFEIADGGTLFLDEIGEMPLHLQSKLLSVLEDRTVRRIGGTAFRPVFVRVIAATNADLEQNLGKTFRKDLYYRLSVIRIHIPPLRDHRGDIPELCSHILTEISSRITGLPQEEIEKLMAYDWPGNVRELKNVLERTLLLQRGSQLFPSQLIEKPSSSSVRKTLTSMDFDSELKTIEQAERELIEFTLAKLSWNVTQSARALGLSLSTLKRKIKEYGFSSR